MATFSYGVKCFRSFLIRSLRYLNGRTLSPFPTEAGQFHLSQRAEWAARGTSNYPRIQCPALKFVEQLILDFASGHVIQSCPRETRNQRGFCVCASAHLRESAFSKQKPPARVAPGQVHPIARSKLSHGLRSKTIAPVLPPLVLHVIPKWNFSPSVALLLTQTLLLLRALPATPLLVE
jgi:hypothetical protein